MNLARKVHQMKLEKEKLEKTIDDIISVLLKKKENYTVNMIYNI